MDLSADVVVQKADEFREKVEVVVKAAEEVRAQALYITKEIFEALTAENEGFKTENERLVESFATLKSEVENRAKREAQEEMANVTRGILDTTDGVQLRKRLADLVDIVTFHDDYLSRDRIEALLPLRNTTPARIA